MGAAGLLGASGGCCGAGGGLAAWLAGWRGALGLWGSKALLGSARLCSALLGSGLALTSGLWALGWAWSWAGI